MNSEKVKVMSEEDDLSRLTPLAMGNEKADRFSKNYKNIFQGAGSRITAIFSKPPVPESTVADPPPTDITFKQIRPARKLPSGTKISDVLSRTKLLILNGSQDNENSTAHKPAGISSKEWFAINAIMIYNEAVYYLGWVHSRCTPKKCPRMTAGKRYEFKWSDGKTAIDPVALPAYDYCTKVLDWVKYQFKDVSIFPNYDGAYYSRSRFLPTVQSVFKRLLRIYAHLLCHHFDDMKLAQVDHDFVKILTHFLDLVDRFELLVESDTRPVTRSRIWFDLSKDPAYKINSSQ